VEQVVEDEAFLGRKALAVDPGRRHRRIEGVSQRVVTEHPAD
jgi:hypothetical protein